jgi:hypothetical protein
MEQLEQKVNELTNKLDQVLYILNNSRMFKPKPAPKPPTPYKEFKKTEMKRLKEEHPEWKRRELVKCVMENWKIAEKNPNNLVIN